MRFIPIPDTNLEIASHGRSHNRILFFRVEGTNEPINAADDMRVVLIGTPERYIRAAMKSGHVSRNKLSELIDPVSGNTYHKLRQYLDGVVR